MSIYDVAINALDGSPADLHDYDGKAVLVVNVASRCGLTPQYTGLEQIHEQYAGRGFTPQYEGLEKLQRELHGKGFNVLGFPSNDFGQQEPGTAEEIATFCKRTYDVTFPMFEKVVTQKGAGQSPIYAFLGQSGHLPSWNFAKYLVDKQGRVVAFFPSEVTPEDSALRSAITKALAQ